MELNEAVAIAMGALRSIADGLRAEPSAVNGKLLVRLTQAADVLEAMLRKASMLEIIDREAAALGVAEADAARMAELVLNDNASMSGVKNVVSAYKKRMIAAGIDPDVYEIRLTAMAKANDSKGARAIFKEIREKVAAHEKGE